MSMSPPCTCEVVKAKMVTQQANMPETEVVELVAGCATDCLASSLLSDLSHMHQLHSRTDHVQFVGLSQPSVAE